MEGVIRDLDSLLAAGRGPCEEELEDVMLLLYVGCWLLVSTAAGLFGVLLLELLDAPLKQLGLSIVCWSATGVSHSFGKQRWRKGTQDDM